MRKVLTKILLCLTLLCLCSVCFTACSGEAGSAKYTITFDLNGGTGQFDEMEVELNSFFTLPTKLPTKSGYVFNKWTLDGVEIKGGFWTRKSNATVKAEWTALFEVDDGVITDATEYTKENMTSLVIPQTVDGETITEIGAAAFAANNKITSVTLPSSITNIDVEAFFGCDNLKTVNFSENGNLSVIGEKAFGDCQGITELVIPSSVTLIGDRAFENCTEIKAIVFADGGSVERVGAMAFKNCTSLSSIKIPVSVTEMSSDVFAGCTTNICYEGSYIPSGWDLKWNSSNCKVFINLIVKDKINAQRQTVAINKNEYARISLSDYGISSATIGFIEQSQVVVSAADYSINSNEIRIKASGLVSGYEEIKIVVQSGGINYQINVDYVKVLDYKIGTKAELQELLDALKATPKGSRSFYAVLTDDIDFADGSFDTRNGTNYGYFSGELDGQGHTVYNVRVAQNGMFWGFYNCTLKNIAFTNVLASGSASDNALLFWMSDGSNVFENLYIEGSMPIEAADDLAGLGYNIVAFTLKNVIAKIEFSTDKAHGIISKRGEIKGSDIYGVSQTAKALTLNGTVSATRTGLFQTEDAFRNGITPDSLATFDSAYWDTSSGIPVWKTLPTA